MEIIMTESCLSMAMKMDIGEGYFDYEFDKYYMSENKMFGG